jgi:hypothetical protein
MGQVLADRPEGTARRLIGGQVSLHFNRAGRQVRGTNSFTVTMFFLSYHGLSRASIAGHKLGTFHFGGKIESLNTLRSNDTAEKSPVWMMSFGV